MQHRAQNPTPEQPHAAYWDWLGQMIEVVLKNKPQRPQRKTPSLQYLGVLCALCGFDS
jgi:hypothetical protein